MNSLFFIRFYFYIFFNLHFIALFYCCFIRRIFFYFCLILVFVHLFIALFFPFHYLLSFTSFLSHSFMTRIFFSFYHSLIFFLLSSIFLFIFHTLPVLHFVIFTYFPLTSRRFLSSLLQPYSPIDIPRYYHVHNVAYFSFPYSSIYSLLLSLQHCSFWFHSFRHSYLYFSLESYSSLPCTNIFFIILFIHFIRLFILFFKIIF